MYLRVRWLAYKFPSLLPEIYIVGVSFFRLYIIKPIFLRNMSSFFNLEEVQIFSNWTALQSDSIPSYRSFSNTKP